MVAPLLVTCTGAGAGDELAGAAASNCLSILLVSRPPGVQRVKSFSFPSAIAWLYVLQVYPQAPQSSCAIADISTRGRALPSESFMRSAMGNAGSCQGISSGSGATGAAGTGAAA